MHLFVVSRCSGLRFIALWISWGQNLRDTCLRARSWSTLSHVRQIREGRFMARVLEHRTTDRELSFTGRVLKHMAAVAGEARSFDGVLFESDGLIVGLKELVTLARLRAEMDIAAV